MTSFETVAIIILIALGIAIVILKSWNNYNDENEANDEEIKGYVFDGIRDIMSTIEVVTGRTVEDTKDYVIKETTKKLTTLREESGIKFNLSEGTLTELITAVIDNNFEEDINAYIKDCEVCHEEDCTCDEASDNIDTGEPAKEVVNGDEDDEADVCPEEEDKPAEEIVEDDTIEEPFDTLKDDEGNEVDVPAGDVNAEPAEIEDEPAETDSVEEEAVEEAAEETVVTEEPVEEETQEEVHTTEDCTCIECMTKPQIKAWAADHGIFVSSKMLKNDMIAKVKTEFEAQTATK